MQTPDFRANQGNSSLFKVIQGKENVHLTAPEPNLWHVAQAEPNLLTKPFRFPVSRFRDFHFSLWFALFRIHAFRSSSGPFPDFPHSRLPLSLWLPLSAFLFLLFRFPCGT